MLRLPLAARRAPRLLLPRPPARTLFGWSKKPTQTGSGAKPILTQDNLFHPLSESPIKTLQLRAKAVKELAPCPVCLEHHEQRRQVNYDCPDCGWPTHCSEFHWKQDTDHTQYCTRLREVNEDEHDIRSGRKMTEFELPVQVNNHTKKLYHLPTGMYSGTHAASTRLIRTGREDIQASTSTDTFISLLIFNLALRYSLHAESPTGDEDPSGKPPMRIFIIGARAESSLPTHVWEQLAHLFPNTPFHIYMIGPQVSLPAIAIPPPPPKPAPTKNSESTRDAPKPVLFEPPIPPQTTPTGPTKTRDSAPDYGVPSSTSSVSDQLTITCLRAPYADVHAHFAETFDPYTDVFFAFCPGFGFPSPTSPDMLQISAPGEWGTTVPLILSTKCALFVTGFSPTDVERDVKSLETVEGVAGEFDWVVTPGENPFGSEKWEVADFDPRVMVKTNWGVWGIRGKRREVDYADGQE
ncbi:Mss51p [Rhizoctonia solani AG-1 IA]|uniref:Mss51p n=1 Tax=Thanatephorus cucumeris (strain AG1-IA) TaxID=983506 RepID=L8X865_THACA|nr:Mss51p [Rhizoctonia solani AG-1 IA]